MSENDGTIDRRTVLARTGAAVGAVVGATGGAAASRSPVVTCAVLAYGSLAYDVACPTGSYDTILDRGTTGQVLSTCTASDGVTWAYFSPDMTIVPAYWVREQNLDPC